jgi:hypothetical protein
MIKYFLSYRMNGIDELTLRLLTSKKKYNAYLETVEPDKSAEIRDYCKSVKANRKRIITLFESYLDDPEKQTTNELDDAIEFCLKEFLKHFEIRDREAKSARNDYDETSEGSDSCEATKETDESEEESCEATKEREEGEEGREKPDKTKIQNSFWGKTIMKGHFAKR